MNSSESHFRHGIHLVEGANKFDSNKMGNVRITSKFPGAALAKIDNDSNMEM